ncbi:MAG: bifunctional UDP-N-acetylglucosamine diphosphorylase/glucosamine-1-phosphate N-acetyltransferase GlmU [Bacillota bacterium]|jgi:bifunctional UDP-N-acetylglucosamine pyrophosphorylase / glucosamine-1-phosphate N-acetyltransferase
MSGFAGLVLAAGHGTRMKSELLKVLHPVMGVPMVSLVVGALCDAGIDRPAVVIGYQGEAVRSCLGDAVSYVHQEEQRGTGHAVSAAAENLEASRDVLVVNGDVPLVTGDMLGRLMRRHRESGAAATLLTAVMDDPTGLGRVVRDESGEMVKIVEETDASHAEAAIREINTAIACFRVSSLLETLPLLRPDNVQGEYYLPDVFPLLHERGLTVQTVRATDNRSVLGVNTRRELAEVTGILRGRILDEVMDRGVTVMDPDTTWIYPGVEVECDTVIYPFTTIETGSRIGSRCHIGPMTHLIDARLGDDVSVRYSLVTESCLGDGVTVGPFSHLRPGNELADGVRVGNFAEVKNSRIDNGSKLPHHCYVGDAEIGEGVNVGAGTITVNYDGRRKHRTVVGNRAFIGCNSNLIAPVEVGEGGFVAAGSTITRDVPPDGLAVARGRQKNKEGWAHRYLRKD